MVYSADDIEEREDEPRELSMALLDKPGRCCMCHKPGRRYACWRCSRPVCMDLTNYQADSTCGGWIMDWWSNGVYDYDNGNEFWCKDCLEKESGMAMENWIVVCRNTFRRSDNIFSLHIIISDVQRACSDAYFFLAANGNVFDRLHCSNGLFYRDREKL